MEGERRKRKVEEEKEEENEDEKMENFFALIKSSRVVRERMAAAENRGKAAGDLRPPAAAAWNPTFRLEDFLEPAAEKAEAGPSFAEGDKQEIAGTDDGEKAIGDDKGLDLNLSL
ncbi:Unknown protein [Striga hermonthica]|uniref:Uncharacterized protein n=1 Tax=Striga hermonthica TaxID=68872 RepID=A0A9N7NSH4_STRHE|nr:Unknown protein [Striga hermonthica]